MCYKSILVIFKLFSNSCFQTAWENYQTGRFLFFSVEIVSVFLTADF